MDHDGADAVANRLRRSQLGVTQFTIIKWEYGSRKAAVEHWPASSASLSMARARATARS
jgi:hypothetical protein